MSKERLQPGMEMPSFRCESSDGRMIDSESLRSGRVMISFYRYTECLFCNLRIHDLMKRWPEWEAEGLQIVAIFQSPEKDVKEQLAKHKIPFPVIADPERKLYRQFALNENSPLGFFLSLFRIDRTVRAMAKGYRIKKGYGSSTLLPADFLIKDGIVQESFYAKEISDHMPFRTIENFMKSD